MDILVVSHLYPTPNHPVSGIFVHEQVKELQKRGHSVHVVSPTPYVPDLPLLRDRWKRYRDTPSQANIEGIAVRYPKHLSLPTLRTLPLVAGEVRRAVSLSISNLLSEGSFSPDLINAHVPIPDGYACLPVCRQLNIPLVTTVHGASIQTLSDRYLCRKIIRTVLNDSHEVIFNSGVLKSKARLYYPSLDTAHIIHNGIPVDKVKSATPAELPSKFLDDRLVVTSVGSLLPRKGQRTVLEAIRRLPVNVRPNYLLIGEGPQREQLEEEAASLSSPVHFTGSVSHSDVFSYLKSTDVMALPSTDEAFGLAYIEAMACECSVIGCEREGPSEFVSDGNTGFLIPGDDAGAVADCLTCLNDDRDRLQVMAEEARIHILKNFTWKENARQTESVYLSATS